MPMVCLSCSAPGPSICLACRLELRSAPDRVVGAVPVRSATIHQGSARRLVHVLKYRGVLEAATVLSELMVPLVEPGVVLVPLPRVAWRRLRHGVDPALELATALAKKVDGTVWHALSPPVFGVARAGKRHGTAPVFRRTRCPGLPGAVLVDDVVTSGATIAAAASVLGEGTRAITATAAPGRTAWFDVD